MTAGLFTLPLASADMPLATLRAGGSPPAKGVSEVSRFPDYFVVGPENALVRELAAAAISDLLAYNPLVLCGPIGVGKTALAHSLAALRRDRFGASRVIATTGSDLAGSLAHAVETDGSADFRASHHECDILLIDDLHQIAGKPAALQFLLVALDAVMHRGALVIATLRHLPQATEGLLPALAGRLAAGLVVPLAPPKSATRRELVRRAAFHANMAMSEHLVEQLAGEDGPFPQAVMPAQLRHAVLQHALVGSPSASAPEPHIDAKLVCKQAATAVARQHGLTVTELRSKSRRQAIADARGLAMYLARHISGASYAEIGRHFGHRDHTTVLHACNKLTVRIAADDATRRLVTNLQSQITADCR